MKTETFPLAVKVGSTVVKIYRVVEPGRTRYTLSFHEGAARKLRQFSSLSDARREARVVAERLNAGQGAALELTGADRDSYRHATSLLRGLDVPLHVAVAEYVKARGYGVPVVEAARKYAETHDTKLPDKTVNEVYEALLEAKRQDGASSSYLHDLKMRLGPFARDFQCLVATVTTSDIDEWLRARKVGARSRNNHRRSLATMFNFAKAAGFLDRERTTAAEHVALAREKADAVEVFAPEDFRKLITKADDNVLPLLALGAFAGMRTAEICRLHWEDIKWAESSIIVRAAISKTRKRRVCPLTPTAAAWLSKFKRRTGPVITLVKPDERVRALCKAVGVAWQKNGMRHTFISARLAMLKNPALVAFECGNSPAIIRQNYDAIFTAREGKKWFSIRPGKPTNVVELPQAASA